MKTSEAASSRYSKTAYICLCGLFAALTAVCSYISVPLGFTPVPVNLATLAVFLSGGLLGRKYGPVSMTVYTLAGAAGIPVFSGFTGGLGVLSGPTGGYIAGYIAASFITGLLVEKLCRDGMSSARRMAFTALSMAAGLAACYALGTLWFTFVTGSSPAAAAASCILPFIPGDILKIIAASILVMKLRHRV